MLVLLLACHHAPTPPPVVAPPPPPVVPVAPAFPSAGIGGSHWGFIDAITDDGLYVAYHRFPDKAGDAAPVFDQHGSPDVQPTLFLREMATGKETALQSLVATTANAMVVEKDGVFSLVQKGQIGLVETGGIALDPTQDQNRCLPPRTVSFDATGARLAYATQDGVAIRDLEDGSHWEVPVPRVWRFWPLSEGPAVVAMQMDGRGEGFPQQQSSCACDWCNRFALSFGVYGWGGPPFHPKLFSPAKPPTVADLGEVAIGDSLVYHPKTRTVTSFDGTPLALSSGCEIAAAAYGQPQIAVTCGTNPGKLWWPLTHKLVGLSVPIAPATLEPTVAVKDKEGHPRIPVKSGGHLSSLNLDDGSLKIGPITTEVGLPSPGGLVLGYSPSGIILFWLEDGRSRTIPIPEGGKVASVGVRSVALEDGKTLVVSDDGRSQWVNNPSTRPDPRGCVLVATALDASGAERGPWHQSCPP